MIKQGIHIGFYKSARWKKIASRVYKRDNGKCKMCGKILVTGHNVDHIIPIESKSPEHLKYGEDNLQLLCIPCHNIKSKEDPQNFRKYIENKTNNILTEALNNL